MSLRGPRAFAAWCGVANAVMGAYVVLSMGWFCIVESWPRERWVQLALLGLFVGGGSLVAAGVALAVRAWTGRTVRRLLGFTGLLGLPAGLGSGTFYVMFIVMLVENGGFPNGLEAKHFVAMAGFFMPLPVVASTACLWLLQRGRLDDEPEPG